MRDEQESIPITVDNRKPEVLQLEARELTDGSYEIRGVARDSHGLIARIEVSRNGKEWRPVFPVDGILDSSEETFAFRTEILEPGEHVFAFAATDQSENTGANKIVLSVP
jgi:hypothetical protein